MKVRLMWSAAALGVLLLGSACEKNVADLPARDHAQDGTVTPVSLTTAAKAAKVDPRTLPVPKVDGRPMWAPNRQHTAEENAKYQFDQHGAEFGIASEEAYVARAHAFTSSPPAGAEQQKRANGDTLIYDARGNTFAVVSKDGAPRTLFKPKEGAAYWAEQKRDLAKAKDKASSKASKSASRPTPSQG
jgi:pyocin large subunit-like protein